MALTTESEMRLSGPAAEVSRASTGGGGGGGSNVALDLGDDGTNESDAITKVRTANDQDNAITEPVADEMLIDLSLLNAEIQTQKAGANVIDDPDTLNFSSGAFDYTNPSGRTGMLAVPAQLDHLTDVNSAAQADGNVIASGGTAYREEGIATLTAGHVSLSDLSDVGTTSATDGHVIASDGTDFDSEAITSVTEAHVGLADLSDVGSAAQSDGNVLASAGGKYREELITSLTEDHVALTDIQDVDTLSQIEIVSGTLQIDEAATFSWTGPHTWTGQIQTIERAEPGSGSVQMFRLRDTTSSDELRRRLTTSGVFRTSVWDASASTGRNLFDVDPAAQRVDHIATLRFTSISGTPTMASHDHSEGGMTDIPNAGLANDSVTYTASDGLIGGGAVALGQSAAFNVRLDIEDGGSNVTGAYGINFGANLTATDDGDNTVTVDAAAGTTVSVDFDDDGTADIDPLEQISTTGDTQFVFTAGDESGELAIDVGKMALLADDETVTGAWQFNATTDLSDADPRTTHTYNLGSVTQRWLTVNAAELRVATLVAADELITQGGRQIVGTSTVLAEDLTTTETSIDVRHNNLSNGDWIRLEAGGKVEEMQVTSSASGTGPYTYSVSRNEDGSGANAWNAGDAVWNLGGASGYGYIDHYAIESHVTNETTSGPASAYMARTGTTRTAVDVRALAGKLDGWYGYADGSDTFGFAAGNPDAEHITIDDSIIQFFGGDGSTRRLLISGGAVRVGNGSSEHVSVLSGGIQMRDANGKTRVEIDGTDGLVLRNSAGTDVIQLDTSGNAFIQDRLEMGAAGVITNANDDFTLDDGGFEVPTLDTLVEDSAYTIRDESASQVAGRLWGDDDGNEVRLQTVSPYNLLLFSQDDIEFGSGNDLVKLRDSVVFRCKGAFELDPDHTSGNEPTFKFLGVHSSTLSSTDVPQGEAHMYIHQVGSDDWDARIAWHKPSGNFKDQAFAT